MNYKYADGSEIPILIPYCYIEKEEIEEESTVEIEVLTKHRFIQNEIQNEV